ncbi:hypothetical protein GHT06_022299 [Daphnia sinensis]|uniref:Uncharacterized protein n=1 Tax=Daphnia sinensis TaxID=1820382 RepID=A0AAD5KI80_9CRUS|nr:hypothetical protein GHT06_022299 [Daphnia sinensis]
MIHRRLDVDMLAVRFVFVSPASIGSRTFWNDIRVTFFLKVFGRWIGLLHTLSVQVDVTSAKVIHRPDRFAMRIRSCRGSEATLKLSIIMFLYFRTRNQSNSKEKVNAVQSESCRLCSKTRLLENSVESALNFLQGKTGGSSEDSLNLTTPSTGKQEKEVYYKKTDHISWQSSNQALPSEGVKADLYADEARRVLHGFRTQLLQLLAGCHSGSS